MKLIDPVIYVEEYDGIKIMKRIESACRTCYRSEDSITEDSYKKLITNCINCGHESVMEHEKITVRCVGDIGAYKDLTRHRFASFSIESTRFCNYGKGKYGSEIKIIKPCNIDENDELYPIWKHGIEEMEKTYLEMSEKGATVDQLRMLLPHSTAAEFVITANIREWRHILTLRCSKMTHPSIRQLLIPLLLKFKKDMPELFDSVPYDESFPKEKYAELLKLED